jgi:transcriptional regulator with XRE-family HTH domain
MTENSKKIGQRIKKLREEIGMSQQDLAERLGLLRPTVSQMENGERKITAEELIKLSGILNTSVQYLMGLVDQPEIVLHERREKMTKPQMRINVPAKKLDKFREVLLYILEKVGSKPNIGETVIYKLLYFVDFNYYEKYEEQLIGATYIKNTYGPTPIEFRKIVDKMIEKKEIIKVANDYFSFPQTKYLPLRKPNLSKLMATEKELIDDVLCRLSDLNASQISEYSHNDVPWITTEDGKTIEYESVFYRTTPYSVREYSETIL